MLKQQEMELKHKTDEQINPVNGLEPWDQFDRQRLRWRIRFSEQVKFWAHEWNSEKVMEGDSSANSVAR